MNEGGLVLWVSVPDQDAERRAVAVLEKMGAHDVHVHEIKREWSPSDIPFAAPQPDLFLESDWLPIKHAPIPARVRKAVGDHRLPRTARVTDTTGGEGLTRGNLR